DRLRLYPDPEAGVLVNALAKRYRVKPEQVFAGVGSDDVLAMAFLTFFNSQKPILFPDITYSFYDVWAGLFRIPYQTVPLDPQFRICAQDYEIPNGGVVFPNPNAPTGELESLALIEHILQHNQDVIVIVDEAYIDFGGTSALPLLNQYENLLIVQTFSKSRSLAGMRIGYAFGSETLIRYLNNVKYSFNSYTMNQLTLTAGAAALRDEAYFKKTIHKIIATRERVKEEFQKLGFLFGDSQSNFLFVTHPDVHAQKLFEALKEEHIYVRYFNKPRIDNYLRITIGTDEEMDVLLDVLRSYLKKNV
ncbi:MAG: aminotransferase class I/II-fold pyridoxal phosphate-dependent enzyme, partial [Eubacterium sp.]|nr:aminotransferase class I/II-fold pyridoxal phosphate-dependent enzyme [Eubacterium sp.]